MITDFANALFSSTNIGYVVALLLSVGFMRLWYGPVMGEVWAEAQGIDAKTASRGGNNCTVEQKTITTVTMYLISILVVSYLADQTGCSSVNDGLWLGALLWLGFAMPLAVVQHSYNPAGKKVVLLVDLSYQLLFYLAQAVCLVYFKNCDWALDFGSWTQAADAVEQAVEDVAEAVEEAVDA